MIRRMDIKDYESLISLWQNIDGMGLRSLDDSYEGVKKFLERNPSTCFVYEENEVQGTILCGHDGRRGYIYHLAVSDIVRNRGIGKELVGSSLNALKEEGINKVALLVFKENKLGNSFWTKLGFKVRNDLNYRNLSLNDDNK